MLQEDAPPQSLRIGPGASPLVWMGAIAGFPAAVAAATLKDMISSHEVTWLNASVVVALLAFACLLFGSVATVRIYLSPERLWLQRFWRTRWSIRRSQVLLEAGMVGDPPILPGFHVVDRRTGERVGAILLSQFHSRDVERLRDTLRS